LKGKLVLVSSGPTGGEDSNAKEISLSSITTDALNFQNM
jgi:hypothetical protein